MSPIARTFNIEILATIRHSVIHRESSLINVTEGLNRQLSGHGQTAQLLDVRRALNKNILNDKILSIASITKKSAVRGYRTNRSAMAFKKHGKEQYTDRRVRSQFRIRVVCSVPHCDAKEELRCIAQQLIGFLRLPDAQLQSVLISDLCSFYDMFSLFSGLIERTGAVLN